MKTVIFAGGSGRRLWPISLQSSPKQFEPIIGDRSTLQLGVDRVRGIIDDRDIFVSTNEKYVDIIGNQLPAIPATNLIGEPMRRDLAAAVGLSMMHLRHSSNNPNEPVAILWGDNYMDEEEVFRQVLGAAESLINAGKTRIVYMGETPRFANDNLGWIGLGDKVDTVNDRPVFGFNSLTYRPPLDTCEKMFSAGTHVWNTGYFVTTIGYICDAFAKHQPDLWDGLLKIGDAIGKPTYQSVLHKIYPTLPEISFDDAVLTHLDPADALVLHADMGWSDPGTLYALKEAINSDRTQNVERGLVKALESEDCLLYNYQDDKLLTAIGLQGMIVINTESSILVVHKDQIPLVKKLVNSMIGTELESYT